MIEIDAKALRNAFGAFPTGVTVVTTLTEKGEPVGFTANSFTSVSLDPPMLLVCPGRNLTSFPVFETCTRFAVNVLAEGQETVSNTFASFTGDRFAEVPWQADATGLPILAGVAAHFSCETADAVPAGDHVVLLGRITDFKQHSQQGLGYVAGRYFSLGLEHATSEAVPRGRRSYAGAIVTRGDKVLLIEDANGFSVPKTDVDSNTPVRTSVMDWFSTAGVSVELGSTYSMFDGDSGQHYTYFLATAADDRVCAGGQYIPIDGLEKCPIASPAERSMMQRFVFETRTQSYGFYVGDSSTGYIHSLPSGDSSES